MMKHTSTRHIGALLCFMVLCGTASLIKAAPRSDSDLSHAVFTVRPSGYLAMPGRLTGFRDRMRAREDGLGGAIEFALFGSKSSEGKELAKHFFPFGKTKLRVQEGTDAASPDRDLDAQHFGIRTVDQDFDSTISICPEQSVIGLGFTWQHSFADCDGKGFWFGISTPLTRVKNNMNFKETVADGGDGVATAAVANVPTDEPPIANMTDAFNQERWSFGKIQKNCKKMTKTRLADIEVRIGYDSVSECKCRHGAYGSVIIPTGNKPTAEFVFEPLVGHNRHFGLGFGTSSAFEIWAECDRSLLVTFDTDSKYFFRSNEKRSFDLKLKPWSRYMQVYENIEEAQAANATVAIEQQFTPGINIFTRDLCVTPGVAYNATTAIVYNSCKFRGELGYNFYASRAEEVKLAKTWVEGPAIKGTDGDGETNPERTISERKEFGTPPVTLVANYNDNLITADDLDLGSAAHPCAIAHIFYGSFGGHWEECREYPTFAVLGGSYEYSKHSTALNRWTVWGKFGVSF